MEDRNLKAKHQETELKLNTWLLPLLVFLFATLYMLSGFRGWLIFLIGSASVWLLALFWVVSLRRNLLIERKLHLAWATVGDSVHEELKLINHGLLPALWVEITDHPSALTTPVRLVSDVGARTARTRFINHLCRERGLYTLGPTRLRTSDPFGIYSLTIHNRHSDTILVTPPLLSMKHIQIAPGGWAGDQRRRRGVLEREISDAGVRDYHPGDSLRRIHWHATAHFDSLVVRQLDASASGDWWIFVDLDRHSQVGKGRDSTLELSIVLAASLAIRGLRENRRVGLALAGHHLIWLEPRADPAHRWRILKALALAEAGERSFADLFWLKRPVQTATTIAITPSCDPAWIASLGRSRMGGQVAFLVDPAEFGERADQSRLIPALSGRGVPYHRVGRSLLLEAYPHLQQDEYRAAPSIKSGTRYLQQGRNAWQNME